MMDYISMENFRNNILFATEMMLLFYLDINTEIQGIRKRSSFVAIKFTRACPLYVFVLGIFIYVYRIYK